MSYTFNLLESRHHVKDYTDVIPDKVLLEEALWCAWKTTPSKNNAMPWKVFVYGPDKMEEKIKVWEIVHGNHMRREVKALEEGEAITTEKGRINPFYSHIKDNPYLICVHAQPRNPNKYYEQKVRLGMYFDQAWESQVDNFIDTSAIEVGMFIQNLSSYLLEKNIDVSYTSCFYRDIKKWHEYGLTYSNFRPIILMSCGYKKVFRNEIIKEWGSDKEDVKPNYKDIIEWI